MFHHAVHEIVEPDQFRDAVSGISLEVGFQRRQREASFVEQFQTGRWALDFGETKVGTRVSGVLNGGWASFCFSLGPGEAAWNGQSGPQGTIALLPPGAELAGRTGAGFSWITAALSPDMWRRCLLLAGMEDDAPGNLAMCRIVPDVAAALRAAMAAARRDLGAPGFSGTGPVASRIAGDLLDAFTLACRGTVAPQPVAMSLRNRTRLARRAEEWMRYHISESVRVPDLCIALGVSRRELEYACRTVFDRSPHELFESLRLHAVRRELLRTGGLHTTVIQIAYAHGVTHLGRFAARYRDLFGESPGSTRRRLS